MGIETNFVKGEKSALFVSDAFAAGVKAAEPTDVTLTIGVAGAAQGATSVPMTSSVDVTLRKNQVLTFSDGSTTVQMLVTADTAVTSTENNVPVDAVTGNVGDGIPGAVTNSHTATWDQLYRLLGTESAPFSINKQGNELNPASYESQFTGVTWSEQENTGASWGFDRSGRFKPDDYAFRQVWTAVMEERELWVKRITAREDGTDAQVIEGRMIVTSYSDDPPADGVVDANLSFKGLGKPKNTFLP